MVCIHVAQLYYSLQFPSLHFEFTCTKTPAIIKYEGRSYRYFYRPFLDFNAKQQTEFKAMNMLREFYRTFENLRHEDLKVRGPHIRELAPQCSGAGAGIT